MLIRTAGLPFGSLAALTADWKTVDEALRVGQSEYAAAMHALQIAFDQTLRILERSPMRTAVYNCRKSFYQRQKLPDPGISASWAGDDQHPELTRLAAAVNRCREAEQALSQAQTDFQQHYDAGVDAGILALQEFASQESFQRALLFSSHTLLRQLDRFRSTPEKQISKKMRQTAQAVLQYCSRMATKTTPLSRFATVSVQPVATADPLPVAPFGTTIVAPNAALLEALYAVLLTEPAFYRALPVQLNPSISAPADGKYTWLFFDGETESFQQAEPTGLLDFLVNFFEEKQRQLPLEQLFDQLAEAVDAERPEVERFILELLDLGFLEWVLPEYGLSGTWSSRLYQFLSHLEPTPLIVETASLVQWLRTAARTLPYQSVVEARHTQQETLAQLKQFFERRQLPVPPIPPERLFYEDVEQTTDPGILEAGLRILFDQLASCWEERLGKPLPESRAELWEFIEEKTTGGQAVSFLELSREFLSRPGAVTRPTTPSRRTGDGPRTGKIGALLQPYRENGRWHAVINSLYPGGGKLFARWLPLFTPEVTKSLQNWLTNLQTPHSALRTPHSVLQFPWQGYFNANNQPQLCSDALLVPGGRIRPTPGGGEYRLSELEVFWENNRPRLRDRQSGQPLELTDLGLEAPETRPPVMQLLWWMGIPYVSLEQVLPDNLWKPLVDRPIQYRARYQYQNLVLARAAWLVEPEAWQNWLETGDTEFGFFQRIRMVLKELDVPRHFFAAFEREQAQYFDLDSPLFMQLFHKLLRQGGGALLLTEMLPVPEMQAVELVCELAVGNR